MRQDEDDEESDSDDDGDRYSTELTKRQKLKDQIRHNRKSVDGDDPDRNVKFTAENLIERPGMVFQSLIRKISNDGKSFLDSSP